MRKKDISKVLTKGSTKQRLLLIAEDIAKSSLGMERTLTAEDREALTSSFTTSKEIRAYNEYRAIDSNILTAIINLQGLLYEVKMNYSNLRGYILVWETMQVAEIMSNHILHEIKDTKERKRIIKQASKKGKFLFSDTEVDPEGYLKINVETREQVTKNKRLSFLEIMHNVKRSATESAIRFISWRKAIEDYMEHTGFNIKTYKETLEKYSGDMEANIIHWAKYQTAEESFIPGLPFSRVDKLKSKYALTVNIDELEVDEDMYNNFKQINFRDE